MTVRGGGGRGLKDKASDFIRRGVETIGILINRLVLTYSFRL